MFAPSADVSSRPAASAVSWRGRGRPPPPGAAGRGDRVLRWVGLLLISTGYYLMWSLSPDSELREIVYYTKLSIVLTLAGGAFFAIDMYRRA